MSKLEYPNDYVGGCRIGHQHDEDGHTPYDIPRYIRSLSDGPAGTRRPVFAVGLKVLAIAICAAVVALALPSAGTVDFWLAMAAFLAAMFVASTL